VILILTQHHSCTQLIEKYEVQRFNIEKLHKAIDQLLIIKVERDKLQEEKELLMEVNTKYDYHIEELKNKVRLLMGELQSQKEGRSAGKAVQEQIKAFNLVDSSTQTIGSSTSIVSSFSKVEGTVQNQGENRLSVATTTVTDRARSSTAGETAPPAPPPAPPAVPEDATLIPPPPPIPFGKTLAIVINV
jgi:preprotein translocase subunit SecD